MKLIYKIWLFSFVFALPSIVYGQVKGQKETVVTYSVDEDCCNETEATEIDLCIPTGRTCCVDNNNIRPVWADLSGTTGGAFGQTTPTPTSYGGTVDGLISMTVTSCNDPSITTNFGITANHPNLFQNILPVNSFFNQADDANDNKCYVVCMKASTCVDEFILWLNDVDAGIGEEVEIRNGYGVTVANSTMPNGGIVWSVGSGTSVNNGTTTTYTATTNSAQLKLTWIGVTEFCFDWSQDETRIDDGTGNNNITAFAGAIYDDQAIEKDCNGELKYFDCNNPLQEITGTVDCAKVSEPAPIPQITPASEPADDCCTTVVLFEENNKTQIFDKGCCSIDDQLIDRPLPTAGWGNYPIACPDDCCDLTGNVRMCFTIGKNEDQSLTMIGLTSTCENNSWTYFDGGRFYLINRGNRWDIYVPNTGQNNHFWVQLMQYDNAGFDLCLERDVGTGMIRYYINGVLVHTTTDFSNGAPLNVSISAHGSWGNDGVSSYENIFACGEQDFSGGRASLSEAVKSLKVSQKKEDVLGCDFIDPDDLK